MDCYVTHNCASPSVVLTASTILYINHGHSVIDPSSINRIDLHTLNDHIVRIFCCRTHCRKTGKQHLLNEKQWSLINETLAKDLTMFRQLKRSKEERFPRERGKFFGL